MTPIRTIVLVGLLAASLLAQAPGRKRRFPPDIVSPEAFAERDALRVDPQHCRLDFENERVRVLRFMLKAGETVPMHDEKDALLVCVTECQVRLARSDGSKGDVHMEAGGTRWIFAGRRSESNVGAQPVELLFIEMKAPPGSN